MVVCVPDLIGKMKYIVQFYDSKKVEMGYPSLSYVCHKGAVVQEVHESISGLPQE